MSPINNIHATTLEIDGHGCLIRGRSGSGKSLLALDLLTYYGEKAVLIADDQTLLETVEGQLIATCPAPLVGKIELYGRGIIDWPSKPSTHITCVIDLVQSLPRMPAESAFSCQISGVELIRIPVPERAESDPVHQRMLVEAGLFYQNDR